MISAAGQRWFAAPFVLAFLFSLAFCYVTYDPIPPRVNVRWSEHITLSQRVALEAAYHLAEPDYADGRTWSYGLLDTSTDNIQRLVQDPAAEDTHKIDRETFELTEPLPAPLFILFRFLVLSSMIGVVVASFVTWVALLPRRAGAFVAGASALRSGASEHAENAENVTPGVTNPGDSASLALGHLRIGLR